MTLQNFKDTEQPLLASSVKHLLVHNKDYDPNFAPVIGKLQATYNGCYFIVVVDACNISVEVTCFDDKFIFNLYNPKPGFATWNSIFEEVIKETLNRIYSIALCQVEYIKKLKKEEKQGMYNVH